MNSSEIWIKINLKMLREMWAILSLIECVQLIEAERRIYASVN